MANEKQTEKTDAEAVKNPQEATQSAEAELDFNYALRDIKHGKTHWFKSFQDLKDFCFFPSKPLKAKSTSAASSDVKN